MCWLAFYVQNFKSHVDAQSKPHYPTTWILRRLCLDTRCLPPRELGLKLFPFLFVGQAPARLFAPPVSHLLEDV